MMKRLPLLCFYAWDAPEFENGEVTKSLWFLSACTAADITAGTVRPLTIWAMVISCGLSRKPEDSGWCSLTSA